MKTSKNSTLSIKKIWTRWKIWIGNSSNRNVTLRKILSLTSLVINSSIKGTPIKLMNY